MARILAEFLDLPASNVRLISSPSNPHKKFWLEGIRLAEIERRLDSISKG